MDLGLAFAAARRRWVLLLVMVLIGLAAGVANQVLSPKVYRSTTTVLFSLDRTGSIGDLADGNNYVQDLVPSYVRVATMPIVLTPVVETLDLPVTAAQLATKIQVTNDPASFVAKISVEDGNATRAAKIANQVALEFGRTITVLSPKTTQNAPAVQLTSLSPASPSGFPISPSRNRNLLLGLIGGLVLGGIAVGVRESIVTPPLTTRREVERVTDVPVLGSVVTDSRASERSVPMYTDPLGARAESFRVLQTTMDARRPGSGQFFAVVSSLPGEGRTSTAVNLAIAMLASSRRVLLIDADLREPAVARFLGLKEGDAGVGVTSVLSDGVRLEDAIHTLNLETRQLDVLLAGATAPNPSELLASDGMVKLLEKARKDYEVVIVDTPPLLNSTDGALVAANLDGAILLVDAPRTKQKHLDESLARLRLAGAEVLGVVINRSATTTRTEYSGL